MGPPINIILLHIFGPKLLTQNKKFKIQNKKTKNTLRSYISSLDSPYMKTFLRGDIIEL